MSEIFIREEHNKVPVMQKRDSREMVPCRWYANGNVCPFCESSIITDSVIGDECEFCYAIITGFST